MNNKMYQQVEVTMNFSVNADLSKEQIHKAVTDMIEFPHWEDFPLEDRKIIKIREEAEIYDVELTEQDKKIAEAKQLLKDAGYYTGNLWTITDVKDKLEGGENLSDDEAQDILDKSLTNEATMEQVWLSISEFGRLNYNLETKK
jgi:hypothetical protein